jgi:hypothetical protein
LEEVSMKCVSSLCLLLVALIPASTLGSDALVRFQGGIGVDPISNVVVSATTPPVVTASPNAVRGTSPAGQIWVISGLTADVSVDGHIHVKGRGLLLAGGDRIGTAAGLNVFATLFCGPAASATASNTSSAGVPLDVDGDFVIDDVLSPVPANPCATPVLLIRNAGGTHGWFAAGIPE